MRYEMSFEELSEGRREGITTRHRAQFVDGPE